VDRDHTSFYDPNHGQRKGRRDKKDVLWNDKCSQKICCAIRILEIKREHWSIENRLHYRRDVSLGEDASQTCSQGASEAIAALNGRILALMDFLGVKNVKKRMRHFCAQPREALQLLLGELSREQG